MKSMSSVPGKLNARLLLVRRRPYASQAVELSVLFLLGVTKGKETQNCCTLSVSVSLLSFLLQLVALDEKSSFAFKSFGRGKSVGCKAGPSVAESRRVAAAGWVVLQSGLGSCSPGYT